MILWDGAQLQIPGYEIAERIGEGGFGQVYRARHTFMERDVAIKVLLPQYSADPAAIARFISEARAIAKLSHSNIVHVFDFGVLPDGRYYCVMELLKGCTLRELLREGPLLPRTQALDILRGIAEAIDVAHAAEIAHRDLKPDNVFLDRGRTKLIDFGLAKLGNNPQITCTGAVIGTPRYMSPEQCRGRDIGLATDAYSFGILAYELLVGAPPFDGEALELVLHHLNDAPAPPSAHRPDLSPEVDRVILSLLAKDPAARPRSLVAAITAIASTMA